MRASIAGADGRAQLNTKNPENDGRTLNAGSVYLEWFPSEFTKLLGGYEAVSNSGTDVVHRLLVQAVFSLGPHKPHPF